MVEIVVSKEFENWFKDIDSIAKKDIFASIETLKTFGHSLGRPHVDTLKGSKLKNLKELRIRSLGRPFRVIFIFDVKRRALLLLGGNKANDKKFYENMIRKAEQIYNNFLRSIEV